MFSTLKVRLVEDDPNLGQLCVESLTLLWHTVTWVTTAAAAFDALSIDHSFEVILLDLRLGDESGESIFEKLQLLKVLYPPVVILSAEPATVLRIASAQIKTEYVLSKPASIGQIDQAIQLAAASA